MSLENYEKLSLKLEKIIEKIDSLSNLVLRLCNEKDQTNEPVLWLTQRDLAKGLSIPYSTARSLIHMPNFPKSETGRSGRYMTGPWSREKVIAFYRINKAKIK